MKGSRGRGEAEGKGEQHAKGALCIGLGMRCAFFVSASAAAAAADQVQLADSAVSFFFLSVFFSCASLAFLAFILCFYLCLLVLAVWLCG